MRRAVVMMEEHVIRDTLSRLAARLPRGRFARIHRTTIVNLDRIRELRLHSQIA